MKLKKIMAIGSMVFVISMFVACTSNNSSNSSNSSASSGQPKTVTITDDTGDTVTAPADAQRIADGFPFHPELLTMLGAGDKVVGTITTPQGLPWLYKVNPKMNNAKVVFSAEDTVNLESLAALKPDVVFVEGEGKDNKLRREITGAKIPVIQVSFSNFDQMKKSVTTTGSVLGSKGKELAEKYNSYFDSKYNMINSVTSQIQDAQKPKVLHILSTNPLVVDGQGTIMDQWIKTAGGVNAATINGGTKEVTLEQVVSWNPDIIIIGKQHSNGFATVVTPDSLMNNAQWQQINAIKNKKVYMNPMGAFLWDRFGPEEVLQIQWAAKLLHPDKFTNLNISDSVKDFYKTFFKYNLTDDDVNKMLNSQPPTN